MTEQIFKDHFSTRSDAYAQYRPVYPDALFRWLAGRAPSTDRCWDCATGSGQAALSLAQYFDDVIATDASAEQISNSVGQENIDYRVATAVYSGIEDKSVDLITVAQALHWFDIPAFFREADRVLKPQGLLAIISYNLLTVDDAVDAAIFELYRNILDDYWPPERRLIEEGYASIELPYPEFEVPDFSMQAEWNLEKITGYLSTWSAVKRYSNATGQSPLSLIEKALRSTWGKPFTLRKVVWPLTLRCSTKPL